jgi:uncharacterized protein (DUF983 family)
MTEFSPDPVDKAPNRMGQGLARGFRRLCPNCGAGPLFKGYLAVQASCPTCGHDNAQYRADDAAPYFTILVIGHLVIGPLLVFPFILTAPIGLVLGTTLPALAVLTLCLLPVIKGAVIGGLWALRAPAQGATREEIGPYDLGGTATSPPRP